MLRGLGLWGKRFFDILVSCLFLIFLAVPLIIIAIFVIIDSGWPIFFSQQRAGLGGRIFQIYKFRTMIPDAERVGLGVYTEENDPRITRVGRWLRKWSFDELPQLINVLTGDMSLVGPRPTLRYQVTRYNEQQRKRLIMRPGITGWAQVNGRNSLTWPERIKLDLWYVEHWSLLLDLYIFLKTFMVVINREKIYCSMVDEISQVENPSRSFFP